ncbi:MAG: TIGR00366 family protein [Rhodomicrobium sp.]|jgi:short-chain fatty acids transporter
MTVVEQSRDLPAGREGPLARAALGFTRWAERWFPDAYIFAALAVILVSAAALANGASPLAVAKSFGDGFWTLIPFTMQMAFVVISGYVVAMSPPAAKLIRGLASIPGSGPRAVAFVAAVSMLSSLLNWGMSLIFSGLLVRELARRSDLKMDYRAAGAAAYLGLGATWALGLSSSAAQLQANPASLPKALMQITGIIPFSETIFLWQSMALCATLILVSTTIAWLSAPSKAHAVTAWELGVDLHTAARALPPRERPSEWLEYSPLITLLIVVLSGGWLWQEFASKSAIVAISSLNTYNFLFLMLGLLLHWRPRSFLNAVADAVPATTGVLIQFPLYGAIAVILTSAAGYGGATISQRLAEAFVSLTNTNTFPAVMGVYSAFLGFLLPSGGGKWVIEAPYVMQAAKDLHVHLGWSVQIYNAAEALPNLINPFWMLPLVGILGVKARDIVGFTFLQLLVNCPLVLALLWYFAGTLQYVPPVFPK